MLRVALFRKVSLSKVLALFALVVLYGLLYKLLIPRLTAFGCMDDCNNFMGGYFLLHGKALFTQIFFNHAPFMAHISFFVQFFTHPQNLYELILRHRQFLLLFGFLAEAILVIRFGWFVLPFAILYETTKFYIGGDRFLAEGFIVYPLCYLLGLVFKKYFRKSLSLFDYLVSALCVWFILFMREPYSIAAILLLSTLLWGKGDWKMKRWSLGLCATLCLITFFSYNPQEFFYNIVYVNKTNLAAEDTQTGFLGINIYRSFSYPIIIFFQGEWNFFRYIEMGVSGLFLFASAGFLWKRQWKWILYIFVLLGLSNIRIVEPGHEYYGAFHLLPWYAMTIFITFLMFNTLWKWDKKLSLVAYVFFAGIVLFNFSNKGSYVFDKIDEQTEFITNYSQVLQVGNVVNALSTPKDTLFVDGYDDMIYYVAHRYSQYQYSWYTSLMPQYKKYTDARLVMFRANSPDFYYGSCPKQTAPYYLLPDFVKNEYIRLYNLQDPSCLWVKKSKLANIAPAQWQKAGESLYYLLPTKR